MLNILTFDGGPGPLLHLYVLAELERELEASGRPSLLKSTDLFAGTSDGALVSLFLAHKLTRNPDIGGAELAWSCIQFAERYTDSFAEMMKREGITGMLQEVRNLLDKVLPPLEPMSRLERVRRTASWLKGLPARKLLRDLWGMREFLFGREALLEGSHFREVMEAEFKDTRLGELDRHVVLSAFETKQWVPRMFRNFDFGSGLKDRDLSVMQVALCSSSLPIVLPLHTMQEDIAGRLETRYYFDGVFSANNPAMSALSLALEHKPQNHLKQPFSGALSDIHLLSLGVKQAIEEKNLEALGGVYNTLVQLFSYSRETRMYPAAEDPAAYRASPKHREKSHAEPRLLDLPKVNMGWLDFLLRPTFLPNAMVHGLNIEVNRQCKRLLGNGGFHRYEPSVNLMRLILFFFYYRCSNTEGSQVGDQAWEEVRWNAQRALGANPEMHRSKDESDNVKATAELRKWLEAAWTPGADTRSAA